MGFCGFGVKVCWLPVVCGNGYMQKNCLYLKHQFGFSLFGFDCGFPCLLFLSWKLLRLASKTSTKMTNGHLVWGVGGERTDRYCDLILFKCPKKLSLKKKKLIPRAPWRALFVYHWTEEMQKTWLERFL